MGKHLVVWIIFTTFAVQIIKQGNNMIKKVYKASWKNPVVVGMTKRVGYTDYVVTKVYHTAEIREPGCYYVLFYVEMEEKYTDNDIKPYESKTTYGIDHERKIVSPIHGYANLWKSHYKVAEKLGYTMKSLYGFSVDTANKRVIIPEYNETLFSSVKNGKEYCFTFNDIKDANETLKAWEYFKDKGYTTDSIYLKSIKSKS